MGYDQPPHADVITRTALDLEPRLCGRCGYRVAGWFGDDPGAHLVLQETPLTFNRVDDGGDSRMVVEQRIRLVPCSQLPVDGR